LVVDADHLRRQVCRQALEPAGYHVTETDDATGALTRIQSDPPDQVLLHADLPQAGAHKITRQLKADILTRSIPVILLVDAAEQDSIIEWLEAGIDDYVILPMEPHRLVLRMRFAAWQRESHRALLDINEDRGEQARAMAVLLDFSHQVAVDNNLDRLLDSTIKAVAELTCSRRISIMLADAERQVLNIARAVGIDETFASKVRVPVGMSTSGTVFQTCQSVIINSEEEAGEYKLDIDCPVFASVPMISTALTTSEHVVGVLNITERQGARPFTPWDIECIHLIANMAASAIHAICTRTTFDHARDSIVVALARLAEHRDPDTGRHLDRVTRFAVMIAEELRTFPSHRDVIDDDFLKSMELAVPLHDIGKVAIPVHILLKPGRLSLDEMDAMRTHAEIGAKTIESAIERATETLFLRMAKDIALGHHEWYDGTGYPRGVRGEDNPLSARITALADVYDAITSKRVYKEAMSHEQAVTLIVDARGSQFDPDVVAAFINRQDDFQQLADQLADTPEELADKTPAREHVEAALAGVPNA
jgi:putative two-component system response regulator